MSKEIFTKYYEENSWNGRESLSGPGSDYEQTKYLISELDILLKTLPIKTMLDVPCGDFNWMRKVNLDSIKYIGGDIVNKMIKNNNKRYGDKNISFEVIDIVNDSLPKSDLIMVRDCFVHLPNSDIKKSINNIKNSKSKYLLTTSFTWKSHKSNNDIVPGYWRRLNLEHEPFNFPFPQQIIVEGNIQSNDRDKTMSLWEIKDIPGYEI
jgi:SAM-dependent methyltransferase